MSTIQKGARMELEALRQDVADGWMLMPNGRPKRVKFQDNDIFGVADYVVFRKYAGGSVLQYRRKYVQVTNHHNYAAHKWAMQEWVGNHYLRGESYELAIYREPHYEGRGKARKWIGKTTWRRELI
jgi:hypothetical protein